MEHIISKSKRKKRNVTNNLWYRGTITISILGGVVGVVFTAASLPQVTRDGSSLALIVSLVFWGLYALSVIAGIMLWQEKPLGIILSLPILALQIPQFNIGRLSYRFVVGLEITPYLHSGGFAVNANLSSEWQFNIWPQSPPFAIGINLVALLMFITVFKQYRKN